MGAVKAPEWDPAFEKQRTVDGSWNDLANPTMGMAGTRFGRNVPIEHTWPDTDRHAGAQPAHREPPADDARRADPGDGRATR